MAWYNSVADKIDQNIAHTINDSKTPSGRVHVGALRGVLIHDAVFRVLRDRSIAVRYLFGVDDYDPLDELPAGQSEYFEKYLGVPLCNVPPPPTSKAEDMAEHYISEFFDIFRELGVEAETYRMRDIYRAGKFNEAIDAILLKADIVRIVYKKVSNAERPNDWFPFQVVCENCGRIGTTEITSYDGKEVTYSCKADLVKWAKGCGYKGKVSPFDGNGKLPWKLEWVAKWHSFPVTIEGAGKDHVTKGGSRDVAAQCLREIFGQEPPLNIPYEFFLVDGAKMSSSRGVGASARGVADFLPPEILRFSIIKVQPNRQVNFSLGEDYIVKLFNEFDRCHYKAFHEPSAEGEAQLYKLSEVFDQTDFYDANFQLVLALIQMPHLDLIEEIVRRKGGELTDQEKKYLLRRAEAARFWLEHFATPEDRIVIQKTLPMRASLLTEAQGAFLHLMAAKLESVEWEDEALQSAIFDVARLVPLAAADAFKAIYRVLLDSESGPRAGSLLAFLDAGFVKERFNQQPFSKLTFWEQASLTIDELEQQLKLEVAKISQITPKMSFLFMDEEQSKHAMRQEYLSGIGVIEFLITRNDGKTYMKRIIFDRFKGHGLTFENEVEYFEVYASEYIQELSRELGIPIQLG